VKRILYTIITITLGCAPTCDEPAETSASAEQAAADPEPCGLSCAEDRDCNSDRPNCCDGVCREKPCNVSEAP
jgi:hypothetical protein